MENIAKALAAFQKDLPKVGKDKTAKMGTYSYKYTDLGTLTHTVMPVLNKHGLTFVVAPRATDAGYEAVGILLHTSGESSEGSLPLFGRQNQELGSALSYARRYLFSAMTGVVTEDDDDGAAAVKAPRTKSEPVKDWGAVIDTASGLKTVESLRQLWQAEGVGKAPDAVQATIKQMVADAKAKAGDDA
jgi:hypothetical protein